MPPRPMALPHGKVIAVRNHATVGSGQWVWSRLILGTTGVALPQGKVIGLRPWRGVERVPTTGAVLLGRTPQPGLQTPTLSVMDFAAP